MLGRWGAISITHTTRTPHTPMQISTVGRMLSPTARRAEASTAMHT